jgi:hypothetical protein
MAKYMQLDIGFETIEYHSEVQLRVVIRSAAVADWCLALLLLVRGLVDSITVANAAQNFRLTIAVATEPPPVRSRAKLTADTCRMEATKTEIDYWLEFFLIEYRDGAAPVNHIDVETESTSEKSLTVTFITTRFGEPLPEPELRRRLGL